MTFSDNEPEADRDDTPVVPPEQEVQDPASLSTETSHSAVITDAPGSIPIQNGAPTSLPTGERSDQQGGLPIDNLASGDDSNPLPSEATTEASVGDVPKSLLSTNSAPPKGSLAEFVQRTREKAPGSAESAASNLLQATVEERVEKGTEKTAETVVPGADHDVNTPEADHVYEIPVWGTSKRYRRQPGLPILYQLFQEPESWEAFFTDNYTVSSPSPLVTLPNSTQESPSVIRSASMSREGPSTTTPVEEEQLSASDQSVSDEPTNEFVNGLDDIDKLFEDISPPDELDVAGEGTSIQEVVMGSATRVLLKRVRRIVGFLRQRTSRFAHWTKSKLQAWREHHGSPVSWLQDADGDWAPLRLLRNADGDFAPFWALRDDDGDIPWKQHVNFSIRWLKKTSVDVYERFDNVLDGWFSGSSDDDDLDIDFIIDQSTRAQRNTDD